MYYDSKLMKQKTLRGKGTYPEKIIRRILTDEGIKYYLNVKSLPGKPDVLVKGTKKIIIINGCFWHRHACKQSLIPSKNQSSWLRRLQYNQMRDFFVLTQLVLLGYDFIILWECEIKNNSTQFLTSLLIDFLKSDEKYSFINTKRKEQHD